MTKAMQLLSHIVKEAREAEELLDTPENKQVAVEIRFAAEAVIEAHKWKEQNEKPHSRHS